MRHFKLNQVLVALAFACTLPAANAQFGNFFQGLKDALTKPAPTADAIPVAPPLTAAQVRERATAFANKTTEKMVGGDTLKPMLERLYIEGERNATLNLQRLGLAAMHLGELELAGKVFEVATARIEMVYADNPEAQKAKSLWTAEKVKDYKGEPYERAMAHYYRGLVYAAKGDFQNARAMFKQAEYQDTVAELEQYAGDFGLMPYMAGWASYCDGNMSLAKEYLERAAKGDSNYASAAVDQPVLVLFETGRAPRKVGAGQHKEMLKFESYNLPETAAIKACETGDNCTINAFVKGADIGFQATTRGGRPFDAVLNGKASFKGGTETVAKVADTVGSLGLQVAAQTGNSDSAMLGLAGMFAGFAAKEVAKHMATEADIREWEQLPSHVWLGYSAKRPSATNLQVSYGAGSMGSAKRFVDTPKCQLYWGRDAYISTVQKTDGAIETGVHPRDPVFRREMEDLLNGGV